MLTLGIETSCDETSVAIVKDGRKVISNKIFSQIHIHKKYGGVVPEVASRNHIEAITFVLNNALKEANIKMNDLDLIGVTNSPGLIGALLVGVSFAKGLAYAHNIPLIGINHIKAHIFANLISDKTLKPPFLSLVISGGHSHLIYVKDYNEFILYGMTRDDAVGEAYDKVARVLGLSYPGGVEIDKLAKLGNENAIIFPKTKFHNSYDFSFSGIKSNVLNYVNSKKMKDEEYNIYDICASFQKAVNETLIENTLKLAEEKNINRIVLAGGVACNSDLRVRIMDSVKNMPINVSYPTPDLCTDNAAMVATAAYYEYQYNDKISYFDMDVSSRLNLQM